MSNTANLACHGHRMSRQLSWGPILLDLSAEDVIDFGWDPVGERIRLVTRSPEHVATRRGSLISVQMSKEQLRGLVALSTQLLKLVDSGQQPGERPLPAESRVTEEPGLDSPDAPRLGGAGKES